MVELSPALFASIGAVITAIGSIYASKLLKISKKEELVPTQYQMIFDSLFKQMEGLQNELHDSKRTEHECDKKLLALHHEILDMKKRQGELELEISRLRL